MKVLKFFVGAVLMVIGLAVLYGISPIGPVREVLTFITIDAPEQQVWPVLANFGAYRQWNPFFTEVDGRCATGEHLRMQVQMQDRTIQFSPVVRKVSPAEELDWSEHSILPGLFDGRHQFVLERMDTGQTRLVQHAIYSGAFAPLLMDLYESDIESGFRRVNDAVKKRVEQNDSSDIQIQEPPL